MEQRVKVSENYIYIGADEQNKIGYIKYYINRNNIIVAETTYVLPKEQNKGYAKTLFLALIKMAKQKNTKIMTYCSYINRYLKTDEFNRYLA